MKKIFAFIAASVLCIELTGCATPTAATVENSGHSWVAENWQPQSWQPQSREHYGVFILAAHDASWHVLSVSSLPLDRQALNQEVFFYDVRAQTINPYYPGYQNIMSNPWGVISCAHVQRPNSYTPCTSPVASESKGLKFAGVLFGSSQATITNDPYFFSRSAIAQVVQDVGASNLRSMVDELRARQYDADYPAAQQSTSSAREFIKKYEDIDAKNRIPTVRALIPVLLAKERKEQDNQVRENIAAGMVRMAEQDKQTAAEEAHAEHDAAGRKILRGPQPAGDYIHVHIISDSYGVSEDDGQVYMRDSVVDAPACIKPSHIHMHSAYGAGMTWNCRWVSAPPW